MGLPCPFLADTMNAPVRETCSAPLRGSMSLGNMFEDREEILPTLPPTGCIPRISIDTFAAVMNGEYNDRFDKLHILDCRFDYEYENGHIRGATNCTSPRQFIEEFFLNPEPNALIIFHCEFSHNRGPKVAMTFRNYDREVNKHRYPYMHYPHVYIIHGGYREFYERYGTTLCDGGYVQMLDEMYRENGALTRAQREFNEAFDDFNFRERGAVHKSRMRMSLQSPKKHRFSLSSPIRRSMCTKFPPPQFMR